MQAEFIAKIADIPEAEWRELWATDYPFVRHAFLDALEGSGCVTPEQGWQPYHLLMRDPGSGRLAAAMPLYVKGHSYGEYVFDWQWADAYEKAGERYYPKLVNAIPFTPATGPRMASVDAQAAMAIDGAIKHLLESSQLSGFHSLFPSEALAGENYLQRLGCQFHWFNRSYTSFDAFLGEFSSRKRKNLNKERRRVQQQGLTVRRLLGDDLTPQDWQAFYSLYERTYLKRSGHTGYLNAEFFRRIGEQMPEQLMMVKAESDGELQAAALYFFDSHTLYGRYWGAFEELDCLHFECCYYQGIEFCIERGLQRFDPGAQGEHKIARGFTPVLTHSYHHLSHSEFHHAVADFLVDEHQHNRSYCRDARTSLPFKEEVAPVLEDILLPC